MHNWAHDKHPSTGPHGYETQTKRPPFLEVSRYYYVSHQVDAAGAKTEQ